MTQLTHAELIERIAIAMQSMGGQELADLYNKEFGSGMTYLGDDQFEQETNEDDTDS